MGAVEIIYDEADVSAGALPTAEDANVEVHTYFPTSIYTVEVPEYLDLVKSVAVESVPEEVKASAPPALPNSKTPLPASTNSAYGPSLPTLRLTIFADPSYK